MRRLIIGSFVLGLCVSAPATAMAQRRVPRTGSSAIGFEAGAFLPNADGLDNAPLIGGFYEYYVTPRVSLRGSVSWSEPSFAGSTDSLRQLPLGLDLNYNWEGGKWHPFIGVGGGAYFMQFTRNGESIGNSETKFGLNIGGGIEYFFNRKVAFKGEGRYHAVDDFAGVDPSGVAFTAGLKTYF